MWCSQNFALIKDNKIKDVIVCDNYDVASQLARNAYGDDATAQDVTRYQVQSGDDVQDNKFYRSGKEIKPKPTIDEKIAELHSTEDDLAEAACDLNVMYDQRLSDIEEALCELSLLKTNTEGV